MSGGVFTSTDLSFSEVQDLPYEDRVVSHVQFVTPIVSATNRELEVEQFPLRDRSFGRVVFTNGEREIWPVFDYVMDSPGEMGYFLSDGKKYFAREGATVETTKEPI